MAKLLVQSHTICPEIQVDAFELVDTIFFSYSYFL